MLAGVVIFILSLILASIVIWTVRHGISPTPSSAKAKTQMLKMLNEIPSDFEGQVYELGSGWGTLAIALAKALPGHTVIAVENSPIPYAVSRLLQYLFSLNNLKILKADFFELPLGDASIIFCYLYPGAMLKLKAKFDRELVQTWVVSNTFAIPGKQPIKTVLLADIYRTPIYLYRYCEV